MYIIRRHLDARIRDTTDMGLMRVADIAIALSRALLKDPLWWSHQALPPKQLISEEGSTPMASPVSNLEDLKDQINTFFEQVATSPPPTFPEYPIPQFIMAPGVNISSNSPHSFLI